MIRSLTMIAITIVDAAVDRVVASLADMVARTVLVSLPMQPDLQLAVSIDPPPFQVGGSSLQSHCLSAHAWLRLL